MIFIENLMTTGVVPVRAGGRSPAVEDPDSVAAYTDLMMENGAWT